MNVEDAVMELREKHAFWSGVVRGVIGAVVFMAGALTSVYYLLQIVESLK